MAKYAIWNKKDIIYTPVGEAVSPEEWTKRFGWVKNPNAIPVIGGGIVNGSFSGELNDMKERCKKQGAEFDEGLTNEELLEAIEAWEDYMNTPVEDGSVSTNERIAAALEAQVMLAMPDEETEE